MLYGLSAGTLGGGTSRRMCPGWLPRRRAILAAATAPHHPTVRMRQAPALPAQLVRPVTWALSPFSPLSLAGGKLLRAEGFPLHWCRSRASPCGRPSPCSSLSLSLPNSLHSSRLTIVPGFQSADLGDDVRRSVAVPPNSWPTSARAAEQENAICPILSPLAAGFSVRKALALECLNGTVCVQIECSRTAWVYLAPLKSLLNEPGLDSPCR